MRTSISRSRAMPGELGEVAVERKRRATSTFGASTASSSRLKTVLKTTKSTSGSRAEQLAKRADEHDDDSARVAPRDLPQLDANPRSGRPSVRAAAPPSRRSSATGIGKPSGRAP